MIEFTVYGEPAPQGSKRHVGHGILLEQSKKVKPWREGIKYAYYEKYGAPQPLEGALRVDIVFTVKKPASAPKTRRIWPVKRPDLDKLVRSTFDGLTQAGAWLDDSQAVELFASKCYPNEGDGALTSVGAIIKIERIDQ